MCKLLVLLSLSVAITIPTHGYEVVQGGYYPGAIGGIGVGGAGIGLGHGGYAGYGGYGGYGGLGGYGAGIGLKGAGIGLAGAGLGAGKLIGAGAGLVGSGLIGAGGAGLIGVGGAGLIGGGAGLAGAGLIAGPLIHGYGGEIINKNVYGGGSNILNDAAFQKASGNNGALMNAGQGGFSKGIAVAKNNIGESGYINDAAAGKKIVEDGKTYLGGQHFNKEGKHGGEIKEQMGLKKGHVIKGFKNSHQRDEAGKTEEYYDEADDEGGKLNFNGQHGNFGEKAASSFKGNLENGQFATGARNKQGHIFNEHLIDNSNVGEGQFGAKKYGGNGAIYGVNNGIDQHSLLGHQENSGIYKHMPFY